MQNAAFGRCHPAVCALFFTLAVCLGVILFHPAALACSLAAALLFYACLAGRGALRLAAGLVPLLCLVTALQPLFNPRGDTVLFSLLGRPYTLEALASGAAMAVMAGALLVWFACLNRILTADKLTFLLAPLAPALSLVLVQVLRLLPHYRRRALQIAAARKGVGLGESGSTRQTLRQGLVSLSGLSQWALEGGIAAADAMTARGYGCGPRTGYRPWRFTAADRALTAGMLILAAAVIFCAIRGGFAFAALPALSAACTGFTLWGTGLYAALLVLPTAYSLWEELLWLISRWNI